MTSLKTESGSLTPRVSRSDELLALAARCEAEGPSRELDAAIYSALTGRVTHKDMPAGYTMASGGDHRLARAPFIFNGRGPSPAFTSSLDAAVTMVPEKYGWQTRYLPRAMAAASVWAGWLGDTTAGDAKTPALALCAAALRALAALSKQEG